MSSEPEQACSNNDERYFKNVFDERPIPNATQLVSLYSRRTVTLVPHRKHIYSLRHVWKHQATFLDDTTGMEIDTEVKGQMIKCNVEIAVINWRNNFWMFVVPLGLLVAPGLILRTCRTAIKYPSWLDFFEVNQICDVTNEFIIGYDKIWISGWEYLLEDKKILPWKINTN